MPAVRSLPRSAVSLLASLLDFQLRELVDISAFNVLGNLFASSCNAEAAEEQGKDETGGEVNQKNPKREHNAQLPWRAKSLFHHRQTDSAVMLCGGYSTRSNVGFLPSFDHFH
jgi:hypothetical protein